MSVLIIGLVFGFVWLFGRYWQPVRQTLLKVWFGLVYPLLNLLPGLRGRAAPWIAILLPVGLLGWLQWWLVQTEHPVAWFAFSTVTLLLAWGAKDLDADVQRLLEATDDAERKAAAEVLTHSYRHVSGEGDQVIIKGIFYQGLTRWFGVLFWFMLAGGAGALFFRLAHAQAGESVNRQRLSGAQLGAAKGLVSIVDFVPAILSTLALAIVGDFDAVIKAWRRDFRERKLPMLTADHEFYPDVGYLAVVSGQADDDGFEHDYEDNRRLGPINTAMSLVWRALAAWLVVIALLVLSGKLS